jgi:TDG/mug DNA glycosylase family protein
MDRATIEVYEREGANYAERRGVQRPERAVAFAAAVDALGPDARRLDLGCGPGHYLDLLGRPAVALDGALAMVTAARATAPDVPAVRGDLADLPFARGAFAGLWASKSYQHLAPTDLPLALADAHRVLRVGGRLDLIVFRGEGEVVTDADGTDDLPGRYFAWWDPDRLTAVVEAAGFSVDERTVTPTGDGHAQIHVVATALRALPDHVAAGMRLLCCGLNPSLHAADAGVGYVTGSNRFWPAMALAGLATRDRDPRYLVRHDHVGMTDLVKRATARADELSRGEYRAGVDRLAALCDWLRPGALAVVGLAGWRAAVDRKATVGWQPAPLGPTPVYVLPSTSGLNARVPLADLAEHLRAAAAGPPAAA